METDCLMGKMVTEHILCIKRSVSIETMINFDGDGDGGGDGACRQTLTENQLTGSPDALG